MSYLHRWGSKVNKNTKPITQKIRNPHRLHIEQLEARINPTDVVVSSLLFRGDLVADGALWKATGKPVEIGFNPTGTEAFRSLVTLTGDTVIDPVQTLLQFKGTGSFPSSVGQVDFWNAISLSSFDIQKMVAGGETIQPRVFAVAGLDFQPGKLLFENPNGGSTEDSRLAAQGSLQFSQLPGFSLAVDGPNQVLIDPTGVTLTGIAASLSGDFKAAGATFTGTKLVATYSSADQSFSVQGASTIAFGANSAVVTLSDATTPGLVIRNGQLSTFVAGLTGTFQVAGAKVGLNALKFSYDATADSISLTGSSSLAFGTNSAALSLNNKGLVIRSGAIENLDATVDGKLQVAGSDLRLNKLTATYASAEDLLRITGLAQLSIGVANPSLDFGTKGLVIQGGAVQSFFATLDGSVSAAGASLVFSGISVYYSKVDSEFSLSNGTASFTLGSNKASVALGERGLVVKSGEIESVDATFNGNLALAGASLAAENLTLHYTRSTDEFRMGGAVSLAFGGFNLDAALAPDIGLVIRSGAIESIDAKVNGSITLAGAKVALTDSAITYSRAADRLTAQGKLAFTYEANSFSVALRNTGLVIEKGQVTSLDGVADGKVQIASCSAALNQLGVSYSQAHSRLQLTGGASVTIGQSSVAFDFLTDKGGLVIQNGALASVNATAKGVVLIDGNEFKLDTVVSYSASESLLECSGAIAVSLADGTKLSAAGLVRLKEGAVQKVVARVGGDITVAGVTIRANELSFTYEASGSVTGLRISMPQGSGGQPSLKIIIPSGVAGQADTEINIPSLDIAAGLRVTNGVLESFTLQISGSFEMKGIKILVDQVSISYSTDDDTVISIQGVANVELEKSGVAVTLGKKDGTGAFTTPGIKLVNGAIDTVDISLAGNLKVGNGFELLIVDAGLIYIPQGQYKDVLGSTQTGPVWGVYGNLSPLGWKIAPNLVMGTRDKPAILFHAGSLVDGGAITANFSTRFGPFTLDGLAVLQPVAADTYIESNGSPGWQQGETLLVDQNNNGTADSSHFIITAKAKLAIPFWKRVYADLEFDTGTSALSRIAISVPTRMAIPGTPLVMTALAGTVENLDNPSNLSIKAQIGLSVFSASDLVTIASKLDNYYENYLDLQVLGTTDGGVSLPDLPSLPTFTPAHFTGEVSYSPGKLVITADAYLFAMGTRYTGDDVFRRADGDWTGLVEATGKIYLDWANSRYFASLNASALGGIFRANALLGMDFAQDIYVVEAGAVLDVEGTAMDFAPLSWVTPVGAQFIVLISPGEKFVGGWVDTPFGPAGVGYNFTDNEVEFIGKTKVKSLKKIAERITAPSVPVSVPVDQRKFNTNFTFNYTVADIEAAGGLPLSESNSITLTTSFQILDDLAYERTDSETRKFPNFIAPGPLSSPCSVYTAFSGSMIENTITDTAYTILPGRFSGDASPSNGMREGTITVTIYPFKLSPGSDYNTLTGELTAAGRERVRLNSTKTFDKSLFSGGNLATITLRSNTPALIVNDKRVANVLTQQALPVPPQGSEPITPTWLKVNDKNYWIDPAYTVTYPLDTVTLDPVTGSTSTSTRQVSKELGLEMTVIKGVTPPAPMVTPGTAGTLATMAIDHHTNATNFQTTTAPVGSTAAAQTSISLLFASQADAAGFRWQTLVTEDETPFSDGGQARAVLFQADSISPTELLAGQVFGPVNYDYLKENALSRPGTPLLFITQENGAKVVRQGVVENWRVTLQKNGTNRLDVFVIPEGKNDAIFLPASAVKPLWLPKANILLNRSANQSPLTRGSTFTAAVVDGRPQGATSDLAIFQVVDRIENGRLPALPSSPLDVSHLVLNPLPAGVSRQVNSRLLKATTSEVASGKWLFNTLDNRLQPVTVTAFGDQTLPTPIGSENIPLFGKVQGSFQLGVPTANGANGALRWEEDRLTGVPQYGFLRVSDGINAPQYSTAYPYTPTPILSGSVKIAVDNGAKAPAQDMVVFVDTNTNGRRDNGEPINITDSQGVFSFYSLNPGQKYQIGVELPGGAKFRAAGAGTDLSDPKRQITIGQDANPEFLLENLGAIYTGRAVIDSNGNAAVDPTDQGAGNVELRLSIAKGSETRDLTTITNNSGLYLFEIPEGWRSVGRPKLGKSQPELGVFVPDVSIQNPTGLPLPDNTQAQPKLIQDDIIAGKVLTITLDGLSQSQLTTFFRQLPAAFVRLKAGDFNAVSLQLFGFKLLIDTFELYGPNTNGLSGLKYASGWAFFGDNGSGQPNQLRFTLGDRKTGGLAIKDGRLQGFQLSLEGSIRVAGVDIGVTGMNARFDAGQLPDGSDGYFQLTGKGTFGYGDYELALALAGEGLIIDANGLRTLSGTVTGSIPIAGQQVELGTLGMVYDRVDDSLLFTGSTQWTMLGDKVEGNYFGLDQIALKIGLGSATDKQAGVRSLSATLAGGFKVAGIDFDVSQLAFAWLPASDAFSISGKSTLKTDSGLLDLTAEFPGEGMVFSQAGLTLNAKVNGSLKLGDTGYTVSVTDSGLSYADGKLGFRFQGGLTTAGTDKDGKTTSEELVSVAGTANFLNGALDSIMGKASGKAGLSGAVVQFTDVGLAWDKAGGEVVIGGEAQLSLLQEGKSNRALTLDGEFSLAGGKVTSAAGSVQAGKWEIAPGFSLTLDNLAFEFSAPDRKYRLRGSCEAEILGVTVGVGISDPGLVWRDGAFESFGGNLTGEWGADLDGNGVREFDLSIQQMGFLYEVNPWRVTITGGGMLAYRGAVMSGGGVTTDDQGIVFGANGLEHLGLRGTLAFLYGDPFDDKNGNFVRESTENYTDRDGNGKYTAGIGIVIANAGVSYTPATGSTPYSLKVTGMGRLAFEQGNLAEQPDLGLSVDLTGDGIEIADGELKNFSLVLGASFRIAGLGFDPSGTVGMRYQSDANAWDLFGSVNATIGKKGYGLALGTSLDNPGIRWVNGSITQVSVGLTGDANLGGVTVKFVDCGLTWDGAKEAFAVFGSMSVKVGTEVTVGLGTRSAPGLVIRDNDWELNGLEFALKDLNLGGFEVTNARLGFSKSEQGFAAWGSALVRVNTVSLGGSFRFANGVLEEISITARPMIPIYGPIILSEISGSIRNLNFKDLSGVVFSATVGLQLLPYEIDMRDLPVVGGYFGKVTVAQLRGTATISPSYLRLQADMYLAASETIVDGKSTWKGLAGQGTAAVNLDWSKKDYYADVDLTLAGNPALPVVGMILDTRFRGRMNFDGNQGGISIRAAASVQLSSLIPVIGGTELASANLFFNFYPEKKQLNMVVWGEANLVFWTQTVGLHIDFWNGKYSVLSDRDDVKARLGGFGQKLALGASALDTPSARTAPVPMGRLLGVSDFSTLATPAQVHTYSGTSSPVPESEVSTGEYLARFRVNNQALRESFSSSIQQLRLEVDPVPGVRFEPVAASFDPSTGIGSVGVRVVALPGQYLPRGMVLRSKLTSPIALAGVRNRAPGEADQPDMEAAWTRAFAYTGTLPAVGTDRDGLPIANLDVTRVKYTVSFRPKQDGTPLPTDWVESVRIYADPLPGTTLQVAPPSYDQASDLWSVVLTYKPVGLTTIGSKFIDKGLTGGVVIRSKVELAGVQEDALGGTDSPDINASWWAAPSEIEAPVIPSVIDASPRVTTLSGRVHDPRFKEIQVTLFLSPDDGRVNEQIATRPDGTPAMDIPVEVRPDGTWSVDITWDPREAPNTALWLYGWIKDEGPNPPIYGTGTPFSVRHDVEGKITRPGPSNAGFLSSIGMPANNILVFADVNSDGVHQHSEPFTFSDVTGRYRLDLPDGVISSSLVFTIPDHYAATPQTPLVRHVDIGRGPVTADLALVATRNILRGYVRVEGNKGQPIPLQIVQASGPDGQIYQAVTGLDGMYEIPVGQAGRYEIRLPDGAGSFEGFHTLPRGESWEVTITGDTNTVNLVRTLHVDSVGIVTMAGENAQGTLAKLVDQANEGLVNLIEFDASLRGATLDVVGRKSLLAPPYMLWDSKLRQWTFTPEQPEQFPDGSFEETTPYGMTAFRIRRDTRINGGDLGISLRGDGLSRAFYVAPDVQFNLSNLRLENFAAFGSAGQSGISSTTDRSTGGGGGGSGLGGALLNFGTTTLDRVVFADNRATGGAGGDILLPAYSSYLYKVATGGLPGGSKGGLAGGAGSGGGHLAGTPGAPIPVTLTYTLGNDPTPQTVTVMIAAGGGGGSGLGGAIYNAPGATLTIGAGTTFTGNSASGGRGGMGSPEFITNLANALFGDLASTVSVTGFKAWEQSQGTDGAGLGGAIFNDGGTLRVADSAFNGNASTDAGAALYALKGSTVINTSAFRENSSGQDQGIRFEGGELTQGTLELNRSMVLAGGNDPRALVATGGRRFGEGNIVSSQTGFAWGVLASSVVARPDSPFTGNPYIPASDGAPVAFGAPVTFSTDSRLQANPRQPFYITTTVSNPAGVGVPGGRVLLGLAGQPVGEGQLNADGSVSVAAPGLKACRYSFDVYYEGDSVFAGGLGKTSVTVGTPTERIVEELYETHLGRESDPSGLKAWSARIDGGLSVQDAVRAFRSSTEAGLKTVERVYQDLLNRLPDQVGRDNWLRFLQTGKTERDLRAQVLASREYTGGHTREEVINRLYETYLGREADSAGMANWLARWDAGVDANTIARAIGSSNEAREVVVDELYQQILAREADQVGRRVWAGALASGMAQDQVEEQLLRSREFTG